MEGDQWGRPGPGGAYWRPSAITGQGFFDKMVGLDSLVAFFLNLFYFFSRAGAGLLTQESVALEPKAQR